MKLTQARIERLLGMDCNTFCSIALIRQDAYGLFLDADSDRRMEVLSALLGLDIYGRMEDIAKASATEQRRTIAALKERINVLGEQISEKDELLDEDMVLSEEMDEAVHDVASGEADLRALESAEALLAEVIRQAEDKDAQAKEYDRERDGKALELEKLESQYQDARHRANGLRDAQDAAERVKAARDKFQELSPKVDRDKELLKELSRLREEIRKADLDAAEGRRKLQQYQDILAKKPDVEAAQAALDALVPLKENAQGRLAKSQETAAALRDAREAKDKHLADSRVRIGELQARLAAAQPRPGNWPTAVALCRRLLLASSWCPLWRLRPPSRSCLAPWRL